MLRLRFLHSIFKASLLRHTLKTLTQTVFMPLIVSKIFRNFFHDLRKHSVMFVTG